MKQPNPSQNKSDSLKALVCIPKRLPQALWKQAHERAFQVEPKNHAQLNRMLSADPKLNLSPAHLAVVTGRRWPKTGKIFRVGFLDTQDAALKRRILSHMNAWRKTANVRFVEASNPEVRIARVDGQDGGYWSYLGTEILEIDQQAQTMNLEGFTMATVDSEFHRVVRHETGHTLGFPHEHMRKELVERIDREKAIAAFMASQHWTRDEVIAQVLTPIEEADIQGTSFSDEDSIMCYEISGDLTIDGNPIRGGHDIDKMDFQFAARIYPKPNKAPDGLSLAYVSPVQLDPSNDLLREFFKTTQALIEIARTPGVQSVARLPKKATEGATCPVSSQAVFETIVATYRDQTGDGGPIKRATPFGDSGVGLDAEAVAALAYSSIQAIGERGSGCVVTGISDDQIAEQSSNFGEMADLIFGHLG